MQAISPQERGIWIANLARALPSLPAVAGAARASGPQARSSSAIVLRLHFSPRRDGMAGALDAWHVSGPLRDFRCNDFCAETNSSEIGGVCGVRVSFAGLGGTAVSCSEAEFPRERARLETRARRRAPGYRIARMHPS
jgi:hypothetical protein